MLVLLTLKWAISLLVIALIALALIITVKLMLVHNSYKHLPGPQRDSFLFGNWALLRKIMKDDTTFGETFFQLHKEYGPVVLMFALHNAVVSVADPAVVKVVLTDSTYLKPAENYTIFVGLFGERFAGYSLVSETNEKWSRHRRVLNPAFYRQYLMELMDIFNDSGDRLVKYLSSKADGKTEVNMSDVLGRVALDGIAKAGFSMEGDMISERSAFNDALSLCFEAGRKSNIDPLLQFSPFKEAREYRYRVKEAIRILRGTGETLIKQRLKDQLDGKKLPKDILSYIIKTAMVDENFQLVEMVDEFVGFFGAGSDTTSNLLSFTLICLGQNPHVMEKLLDEIDAVIGDKEVLLYGDITKLEYMMLVLKETLRLYPPVIGTSRRNPKEVTCLGHRIPPNTMMFMVTYAMCRQEQFFKNPLTFDPERFRRTEDSPLYTYFPFSMGERSCIGQHFALIEARVVLVKMFQKLCLHLVPGQKLGMIDRLTMRPSNDCLHYITDRKKEI